MRKSQDVLRYSKANGTSDEQPNQQSQPHFEPGAAARWSPSQAPSSLLLLHPSSRAVPSGADEHTGFLRVVPPGKHIALLEEQGIGRAALQDAADVLLKGVLRLGQDAERGNSNVFVLSGAQQGRGCRMDCAPTQEHHIGECSLNQKKN